MDEAVAQLSFIHFQTLAEESQESRLSNVTVRTYSMKVESGKVIATRINI